MIKCIAEHSVDLSLLKRDSKVLDLGCRNFGFTDAILAYVNEVIAIDADEDVEDVETDEIKFIGAAICDPEKRKEEVAYLVKFGNGTGNYIDDGRPLPAGAKRQMVALLTLDEIIEKTGLLDLIKMDIEGAEVPVILALKEPPAKQLSIEFHLHTGTTNEQVMKCFDHLSKLGYELIFEDYSDKHGCGYNFWDVLFVNKNIRPNEP